MRQWEFEFPFPDSLISTSPKQVILYCERVTDSMRRAMDETARRRARQVRQMLTESSTYARQVRPKSTKRQFWPSKVDGSGQNGNLCLAKLTVLVKPLVLYPFVLVVWWVMDSMRRAMDEIARRRARQVRPKSTKCQFYLRILKYTRGYTTLGRSQIRASSLLVRPH